MTKRPWLAHWLKYHWHIIRWLPWGDVLWDWADDVMDEWYEARPRGVRRG